MHPRLALAAVCALLLESCSPASIVNLYNDTGRTIVVTALDRSVSLSPQASTEFAVVLARGQHWESVTVNAGTRTWRYPQKLFVSIPWQSWQRGPFESRHAFVRIDSRGRIYLRSSSGASVPQPTGFPLEPKQT
jgi:hypothetical protein